MSITTSRNSAAASAAETSASATSGATGERGRGALGGAAGRRRAVARAAHADEPEQHDRRLQREHRLPRERLRQQAAERRADCGAEHTGGRPQADRPRPRRRAQQQLERRRDDDGAGDALHRARRDEHAERRRARRTPATRARTRRCAAANAPRARPARASHAPPTAATASARLNEISTHATADTLASNSRRIAGSASVTTDESLRTSPTDSASSNAIARGDVPVTAFERTGVEDPGALPRHWTGSDWMSSPSRSAGCPLRS